ncbi:hypothetical protein A3B54_03385 [Candidatus Curtissbacteria bacterium RIFCSPLOWO2_01_FULL_42_50]|uniref:Uncharacterized protein n=1 Tax=Candidatus Curtissbacteria bacterium RIFCSPLOWO2_01_FULL_42_50 TaxID=1797730 RepID=A0A1F5H619_9BACT|nr:MAG: hypothetical protein A3B54_03385 [Candidatus Curtissbacteria bacterium RIFCSPLOWO2_01_FULL_42_50]
MQLRKLIYLLSILVTVISFVAILKVTYATSVTIKDNAAGSQNQVNVESSDQTNINQSNQSNVNNNVDVNCNSGQNSASGNTGGNGSISTGDCSANVGISNNLNNNQANINCPNCQTPTPTPKPSLPTPTPISPPGQGGGPSAGGDEGAASGPSGEGQATQQVLAAAGVAQNALLSSIGFGLIIFGLWQAQNALAKRAQRV